MQINISDFYLYLDFRFQTSKNVNPELDTWTSLFLLRIFNILVSEPNYLWHTNRQKLKFTH